MSILKAELRIVLFANEVEVAESIDPVLWQRVLGSIQGLPHATTLRLVEPRDAIESLGDASPIKHDTSTPDTGSSRKHKGSGTPQEKLAGEIGVAYEVLIGAFDPIDTEPFLCLDHDAWEAMQRELGTKGGGAVSAVAAGATLLGLWFLYLGRTDYPTTRQVAGVLKTVRVEAKNPTRSIQNTDWLQTKTEGSFIIHPAKLSKARTFAAAFCTQDWAAWRTTK